MSEAEKAQQRPQRRLLTFLLSRNVPPVPTDDERVEHPEHTANVLSKITFAWLTSVMRVGYKRTLEPNDLFTLPHNMKVETMANKFYGYFGSQLQNARAKHLREKCRARGEDVGESSVDPEDDMSDFTVPWTLTVWSLFLTFKWQYSIACICLTLSTLTQTLNPLLIRHLIAFVQNRHTGAEEGVGKGIGYSFGTSLLVLFAGITMNHSFYRAMLVGAEAKAVLTKALLDKSFRLSAQSRHKYPVGKITSMMGTDLSRIDFALGLQPFIITFPAPIIAAIVVLIVNLGASALVGIGLMVVFIVFISYVTKRLFKFRKSANVFTDARVNSIKELLNNLRIIKYYSWEVPYFDTISKIRNKEMNIIYVMQVFKNVITAFSMTLTLFCAMCTFLVLYAVRGSSGAASIFSSLTLFNVLTQQTFLLPMALAAGVDALVGINRVGEFMASPEADEGASLTHTEAKALEVLRAENLAVKLKNAYFEWEQFDEDSVLKSAPSEKKEFMTDSSLSSTLEPSHFPGLKDLNLNIKKGEFVVITGLIGTGKSSLLNAIAGFMKKTSGELSVDGSLILCGYPWIQNATVKDNILFGSDLDEKKYSDIIYACSLESDLEILPAGDRTEIGERGITLSGGQKARINLARAVYADREIILLDDVLSAVDARVGKHIVESCLMGLLKERTRILATHQLSLIGDADRIVFLNGDGSVSVGTYDSLYAENEGFKSLMAFNQATTEEPDEDVPVEALLDDQAASEEVTVAVEDEEAKHRVYNQDKAADGVLVAQELKGVNGVGLQVYKRYLQNGSGIFNSYVVVAFTLLMMAFAGFFQVFSNVWLSFWVERKFKSLTSGTYIGLYVVWTFLALFFLIFEFVAVAYVTNRSSMNMNIKSARSVLYSPMSFLDTTPMGRILNRFTKDTDVLDNEIGDQLRFFLFSSSSLVSVIILCIIYLPWFAIAVPFLVVIFVAVGGFYSASSRELKRLESVQRSFVYNNFNETLNGMTTIKAYDAAERFLSANANFLNRMNEPYYLNIAAQRWLTINLTFLACLFSLLIALLCVNGVFAISPASTGLLLSYTLQITTMLSVLLRNYTQFENSMTSVERLCDFAFDLEQEAPHVITETTPPPEWPTNGVIQFEHVSLAYRPGLPLVLKNLNLKINSQEKIGICGRTGAGKSSIMTALFRLSELSSGKIIIDGIDISTLGLRNLRSKLSIIPQDPVLFTGDIRKNLDPFGESSDDKLWDALRRAGLLEEKQLDSIKAQEPKAGEDFHKFHLDAVVENDGSNFSLGERQLIAFARALVRDSNILILDEATSSVDYETDSKIQKTIASEFSDYTILCIAHRLKTIVNYDRILVLDRGEIKEFDTPWNLFNTKNSIFQQMCQKASIVAKDFEKKT